VVDPGKIYTSCDKGAYVLLAWEGEGMVDGHKVEAGDFRCDEWIVTYEKATQPIKIENTGNKRLVLFKFYGPDINPDVPMLPRYGV